MADDYVRMGCAELKKMKLPQGNPNHAHNKRILVVGGGMSGLTAALEAAETGYEVVLVEKSQQLGGWAAKLWKRVPFKRALCRAAGHRPGRAGRQSQLASTHQGASEFHHRRNSRRAGPFRRQAWRRKAAAVTEGGRRHRPGHRLHHLRHRQTARTRRRQERQRGRPGRTGSAGARGQRQRRSSAPTARK